MDHAVFDWAAALPPIVLSLSAVTGLVWSDYHQYRPGRYWCKPLAAIAFIWLALALGATGSSYGQWMLLALLCCLGGDLLLMSESDRYFLGGLVSFLCGHLLFAVAFLQLGKDFTGLLASSAPVLLLAVFTLRWLLPHLDGTMKPAVIAYILVICVMLLAAGASAGAAGAALIITGAWGFACSDLAVARRQFVSADRSNGLWGTPLYFGAQMLLAASVACYS